MKQFQQIIFWVLTASILVVFFGARNDGYINAFYFVTFLMPVIIGTSYMFSAFLVPKYLLQKKYFKFGLYTLYTIIVSLNLEIIVIALAFSVLANYQYDHMIPASKNVFSLALTMYFIVLVKAFVLLIKNSITSEEKIQSLEERQSTIQKGYLIVRADRKNAKILLEDIVFVESLSDYVKINLQDSSVIITKERISHIEDKLAMPFLRIHRSFIINTDKISAISAETIELGETKLPVSRTYKKAVQQFIKKA